MKKLLFLSSQLLSLIVLAFVVGRFLDKRFLLEGWATLACILLAYALWFLSFYKNLPWK